MEMLACEFLEAKRGQSSENCLKCYISHKLSTQLCLMWNFLWEGMIVSRNLCFIGLVTRSEEAHNVIGN